MGNRLTVCSAGLVSRPRRRRYPSSISGHDGEIPHRAADDDGMSELREAIAGWRT
jgi:hypothetical protein